MYPHLIATPHNVHAFVKRSCYYNRITVRRGDAAIASLGILYIGRQVRFLLPSIHSLYVYHVITLLDEHTTHTKKEREEAK